MVSIHTEPETTTIEVVSCSLPFLEHHHPTFLENEHVGSFSRVFFLFSSTSTTLPSSKQSPVLVFEGGYLFTHHHHPNTLETEQRLLGFEGGWLLFY